MRGSGTALLALLIGCLAFGGGALAAEPSDPTRPVAAHERQAKNAMQIRGSDVPFMLLSTPEVYRRHGATVVCWGQLWYGLAGREENVVDSRTSVT